LDYPFAQVTPVLREADITIGNLESSLGDTGQPSQKSYTFQAPPAAAESLSLAGFDIVNLANNHAMDFGPEALLDGIGLLNQSGILTVGAGASDIDARSPAIIDVNDLHVAILGYVDVPVEVAGFDARSWQATESMAGLAWAEPQHIQNDVKAAMETADVVIVILHSGHEYVEAPTDNQVLAARAAVDAGAALVIGHHSHVLQGIEFYGEGVIAYGLGNFAFEIEGDPSSVILEIMLDAEGVREIDLVPAIIQFGGQPRLATEWEGPAIKQRIYDLSRLLNSQ
jgi:poly-gamma-glutamate synthesis protein (capsule biosynthesis protein)